LWDNYICQDMSNTTIAVLTAVTVILLAGLIMFIIFYVNSFKLGYYETEMNDDNKTMTVTEYNLKGDSKIIEDVKAPTDTKGVIIGHAQHIHYGVKHYDTDDIYTIRLEDGRVISSEYKGNIHNVSNHVIAHEEYYPRYYMEVKFFKY